MFSVRDGASNQCQIDILNPKKGNKEVVDFNSECYLPSNRILKEERNQKSGRKEG